MLTLKMWVYALGGVPLGMWLVVNGEPLAATIFVAIGLGSALALVDKSCAPAPAWVAKAALVSVAVSLLALFTLMIRVYVRS